MHNSEVAARKPANSHWDPWPKPLPPTTPLKIANKLWGDGDIVKFNKLHQNEPNAKK